MAQVEVIKASEGTVNRRRNIVGAGVTFDRKRVAAYVRVSTDGEEQLQSFQSQKSYYEEKISKNKDWALVGIYADEAITGFITPVLFELFEHIGQNIKEYDSVEIWNAYQLDGTTTGEILTRGEVIPDGLFHAVAEVFVVHEDGTILLIKRDEHKSNYPGFWESGAGGAILKGESYTLGARRELYEETGIIAEDLEAIYTCYFKDRFYKGYLCRTNIAKDSIRLQEGETIDYKWVDKTEFLKIYESDEFVTSERDRLRSFVNHNLVVEKDCCFEKDNYWFRYRAAAIII